VEEDVAVLKKSVAMIVLLLAAALVVSMGFVLIHRRSKWSRLKPSPSPVSCVSLR
jgi:hypothetical protein